MKWILALLCLLYIQTAYARTITVYTEDFPPFNYWEEGDFVGVSTEIVQYLMESNDFDYEIVVLPWPRALAYAQVNPNSLIFSIARLDERRSLFNWIGELVPSQQSVFTLQARTDISVESIYALSEFRIGVAVEDARERFLLEQGLDPQIFTRVSGEAAYPRLYKMLKDQRIDVWPMPDAVANYIVRSAGEDPTMVLKNNFPIEELSNSPYYLAANKDLPWSITNRLKVSLEEFRKSKKYQKLLEKWNITDSP